MSITRGEAGNAGPGRDGVESAARVARGGCGGVEKPARLVEQSAAIDRIALAVQE